MTIKQITSQHRRDFYAIYECGFCGYVSPKAEPGYDDRNFHENVIPAMECPECGKSGDPDYVPRSPKYPDHAVI